MGYEIFIHSEIKNKKNQNTAENRSQTKIKHKSVSVFGAQLAVCSAAKFVHKTQINRALRTLKSTELSQLSNQQSSHNSHLNRAPNSHINSIIIRALFFLKDLTSKTRYILKVMQMTSRQVEISTIVLKERKEEGLFVVTDSPSVIKELAYSPTTIPDWVKSLV